MRYPTTLFDFELGSQLQQRGQFHTGNREQIQEIFPETGRACCWTRTAGHMGH